MTTLNFLTIFAIISPKVDHSDNILCNNWQFVDAHLLVPFISPKLNSDNKITSCKVDEYAFYIIFKAAFAEKIDNDNSNFELAFYNCISRIGRLFAGDNQT